jgi:branched-chain amino acid transport system ATP-binding protein
MPLLELRNLSVGYSRENVLHDVNLTLAKGEIVTLVGANGAGKSTLVRSVSGLMHARQGEILLDGKPITKLSAAGRLTLGIAHVPEGRQIFLGMTVAENLRMGGYGAANRSKEFEAARLKRVCDLFPILRERFDHIAGNFSGGQQQLLAIARGLMSAPRVLILDEPSLGVAPLLVAEIFQLIEKLRDEGLTILLAEQNARLALAIADRGYVFENGRVTLSGQGRDLLKSPEIIEKYLGVGAVGTKELSTRSEPMAAKLSALIR